MTTMRLTKYTTPGNYKYLVIMGEPVIDSKLQVMAVFYWNDAVTDWTLMDIKFSDTSVTRPGTVVEIWENCVVSRTII